MPTHYTFLFLYSFYKITGVCRFVFSVRLWIKICHSLWRTIIFVIFFFQTLCVVGIRDGCLLYSIVSCMMIMRAGTNNINVRICFMCVSVPMSNNQNQQDDTSIVENQKLSTQVTYNIYHIYNKYLNDSVRTLSCI